MNGEHGPDRPYPIHNSNIPRKRLYKRTSPYRPDEIRTRSVVQSRAKLSLCRLGAGTPNPSAGRLRPVPVSTPIHLLQLSQCLESNLTSDSMSRVAVSM